jgi:hypothetical protein
MNPVAAVLFKRPSRQGTMQGHAGPSAKRWATVSDSVEKKGFAGRTRRHPMPGVWAGGAGAYKKALRQEYESARERLQAHLDQCVDPLDRQAAKCQLEELKRDFGRRVKRIGRCLFGAG